MERKENADSFKEFVKEVLLAPVTYARELRQRKMDLGDKILLGEIAALTTMTSLLIGSAYNRTEGLFHTTWTSGGIVATIYFMAGMAIAWPKQLRREDYRQSLIKQQKYYQQIRSLQESGLIES